MTDDFNRRLKVAVTGSPDTPLVFFGNFEVEQHWARGEHTLPRFSAESANAVVNHMDEFALLLAGADDHVVLKVRPDEDYLAYLTGLGVRLPRIHVVREQDLQSTVTEDARRDPVLLHELSALVADGAHIVAHGVSEVEERVAELTGLPIAGPDSARSKAINSKIYSRRVADELGLRQPQGWACETLDELTEAMAAVRDQLDGATTFAVKEAFGVSGKGIATVDNPRRADRLRDLIAKRVRDSGDERIAFVVERWVAKTGDLNYQFTVGHDGSVRFDFVKEQLTENGVHKGHRIPARITPAQHDELVDAAERLGKRLAADGYFGVVGVDAMVDPDGGLYPVIEINARYNMSTYQLPLQERFVGPGQVALARHYPLRLSEPLSFGEARRLLGGLLLDRAGGTGLLVNNFATVNAGEPTPQTPAADSADQLSALDTDIAARLATRGDRS
jgi:D-alanine-D-alanine ligase-like ATP-grasp enzyme